jgi:hypothetical protein
MLSDDRSQVSFERHAHAIAAMDTDETATVGIVEMNLGVPASLVNSVHLKAGRAQAGNGESQRRAHQSLLLVVRAISAASARP